METASKFGELLKFPCTQNMRFIADKGEDNKLKLIQALNEIVAHQLTLSDIKDSRVSAKGSYVSYTITVKLKTVEELDAIYKKMPEQSFIKHIL